MVDRLVALVDWSTAFVVKYTIVYKLKGWVLESMSVIFSSHQKRQSYDIDNKIKDKF